MTDEELAALIEQISDKIEGLPDDPEKPLTRKEKTRKLVYQLQKESLEKMRTAREKGNLRQEVKAGMDYTLLTTFGEKHPFFMSFLRAQIGWWWGW